MDALAGDAAHLQQAHQTVGHILGVAEGDDVLIAAHFQQTGHGLGLLVALQIQTVLSDVGLVLVVSVDRDLGGVTLIDPGDVHDLAGNRGGEHTQIAALGHFIQNVGHVPDEAHVQHPVGLVQHYGLHLVQTDGVALHVVHQTAGGGHHDLGGLFQLGDLLLDGLTAVETDHAHALFKGAQVTQLVLDLDGQLAGGGQDQSLDLSQLRVDVLHHGDAEGKGLTGAGRSLGNDVLPLHEEGDGAGLDGGGGDVALLLNGPHQFCGQTELGILLHLVDGGSVDFHVC